MTARELLLKPLRRFPLKAYAPAILKSLWLGLSNPASLPHTLQVEPSRLCNLQCVMCFRTYWDERVKPNLALDTFKRLLDDVPSAQCVVLNGLGEPFLNRQMPDMIDYAHAKGAHIRFNTNFSMVDDAIIERLAALPRVEIRVSIESGEPEMFADIRRGTTLDIVLGNIQKLIEARRRHGGQGCVIHVDAVLMKCALPHLFGLIEKLRDMGVDGFSVTDLNTCAFDPTVRLRDGSTMGEQLLSTFMSEAETQALFDKVRGYRREGFKVFAPGDYSGLKQASHKGRGVMTCRELWTSPYVLCDGTVMPCCWVTDSSVFNMGNIREHGFHDIWFGAPYRKLRWQHLTNRHPAVCARCQQLYYVVAEPSRLFGVPATLQRFGGVFLNFRARMRLPGKPR